ncbi:hypothetical protein [Actinokineospora inagensis]|uniref:hypothetical protein n=1 Tax=Actinokineospora inagensis TaxID=103730 RepID=UPI000414A00C|nr:hypothetical protein [Actinokineospora inagensis]
MPEQFSHEVQDALQTPSDVHTEDQSATMLAKLDEFIALMGKDALGNLYEKWRNHPACLPANRDRWASQPVCGDGWQEKGDQSGGLWKLKNINWGYLWGARGRLDNLAKAAGAVDGSAAAVAGKLQGAWSSKAGEAAVTKVNDLRGASTDYQSVLTQLRDHVTGAWQSSRDVVQKLSGFADQSDVGGKTITDRYKVLAYGGMFGLAPREVYHTYIDEMGRILDHGTWKTGWNAKEEATTMSSLTQPTWVTFAGAQPQTAESLHQPGTVKLTDGDNRWSDQVCHELDDFCECYFLTVGNLRRRIEETIKAVVQTWNELQSATITLSPDPFGKLSLAAANPPPQEEEHPPEKKEGQPTTGDDHPGDGPPTSSSGGPGGTGGPRSVPPIPAQPIAQQPVTSQPVAVPGSTDPASAIGPIHSTDPTNPGAVAHPATPAHAPETVTITDGGRSISVQSPTGQGSVGVSVDDGSGKPKHYDLDFGSSTTDTSGTGLPGGGTDHTGPTGHDHPSTDPTGHPATQVPATPDAAQHVQAGPDGRAVIHDGALTITAERPADHPDTVKITVDDGSGKPVTYTVDYQDPGSPTVGPAHPANAFTGTLDPDTSRPGGPAAHPDVPTGHTSTNHVDGGQVHAVTGSADYTDYATADQVSTDSPQATYAASDHSAAWGSAGSVLDGAQPGDQIGAHHSIPGDHGDMSGATGDTQSAGSGEAGLATAHHGAQDAGGQAGSGLGGMPMGAMGGGGHGGGGGGGDAERAGSQWRTSGQLFDDDYAAAEARIASSIEGGR